jgi:anti-sigma-K factor RskA
MKAMQRLIVPAMAVAAFGTIGGFSYTKESTPAVAPAPANSSETTTTTTNDPDSGYV